MLPDNNWYGHRNILLKYLGEKDKEIFAWIQHGWEPQILGGMSRNLKSKIYPLFFWSKFNRKFYNKDIKSYTIGSPFLYLCKILEKKKKFDKPKGTLVFPIHTSQDYSQKSDHIDLIRKVKKVSSGPYTVCFYYRDFIKKNILPYKKKGWKIVCCVRRRNDIKSLYRLYNEIVNHKSIIVSEFTTALFYSMYLKRETKVIIGKSYKAGKYEKIFLEFYKKKYPELFNNFLSSNKGYELAKIELGYKNIKNKQDLKKLLGINSIYKNILAKFFKVLYDLFYGSGLRKGANISEKELKKYIKKARS